MKSDLDGKRGRGLLEVDFVNLEERFEYAAGKYTAAQDVLFCWSVIGLFDYAHLIKEVLRTIYQLVFVTSVVRGLQKHALRRPRPK